MNINPINNITRKALPLAAAAAVGLGALTACSSSKKDDQKPSYVQTEMMKLDKTLEAIKTNRGEGDEAFMDYYVNSRDAIINANISSDGTETSKTAATGVMAGLGMLGLGLIGFGCSLKNDGNKLFNASKAAVLTGTALAFGSEAVMFTNKYKMQEPIKVYNEYRASKLNQLQVEKQQYFDTKDLESAK